MGLLPHLSKLCFSLVLLSVLQQAVHSQCVYYVLESANSTCPSNSSCSTSLQSAISNALTAVGIGNSSTCNVSLVTIALLDPSYSYQDCNIQMSSVNGLSFFELTSLYNADEQSVINCSNTDSLFNAIQFTNPNYEISISSNFFSSAFSRRSNENRPQFCVGRRFRLFEHRRRRYHSKYSAKRSLFQLPFSQQLWNVGRWLEY